MSKLLIILFTLPIVAHSSAIVNIKNQLEKKINCKLYVTSADRTPEHNRRVGGAKKSYHLKKGMALDLQKDSSCKLSYKEIALEAKEFFGLGEGDKLLGFFFLGMPSIEWPNRAVRKPMTEKVTWVKE